MRGKSATIRQIKPDDVYGSLVVAKFTNYIMERGKKALAQGLVYKAMEDLAKETKMGPVESLEQAFANVKPKIELRTRRVGGANYQVPVPVSEKRQDALSMRWIITAAKSARGKGDSADALKRELLSAFNKEGAAYKKKEEVHKMAESNKAFSHLTW
jgi:small subunit ribosomal protein S7